MPRFALVWIAVWLAATGVHADESSPDGPAPVSPRVERPVPLPRALSPASPEGSVTSTAWDSVPLLGHDVAPGDKRRLFLRASESFAGAAIDIPLLVIRGVTPGPTACFTAGIHGDELNGIEVVRQVFEGISPERLSGMMLGVPVANLHGFRRSSRYLPDRRDLNRYFPGHPSGSSASRIANALFDSVVRRCDVLVDFHTGSFHRTNLPQLRADLHWELTLNLAQGFGEGIVVHSEGPRGTLRRAATDAGIPTITYEAGEPMRFQRSEIERGVEGVKSLLAQLGLMGRPNGGSDLEIFFRTRWVRVNDGGIFITDRELGETVSEGDVLASVTDPVSNERKRVISPFSGRIIGMALSQVVIPGFAAFHIGIETEPGVGVSAGDPRLGEGAPPAGSLGMPDELDPEEQPE